MLSHQSPESGREAVLCSLPETCGSKPSQVFLSSTWLLLFLTLSFPLLMPLIQKKRPMLLLRVSYLDWSRLLLSASHLRRSLWPQTAQVSQGSCRCRAGQCSNLRAGLPTCDILVGFTLDAMNCSYSPTFWMLSVFLCWKQYFLEPCFS